MFVRATMLLLSLASILPALEMGRPFGPHMVLPMKQEVPVWGSAKADAEVEVEFRGKIHQTIADETGRWQVTLPPMEASKEPATMLIRSGNRALELGDILTGRVYLCSGQSNMDFPLKHATGGGQEAARAGDSPLIRLFNLTGAPTDNRVYDEPILQRLNPKDHFIGTWELASEKSASAFSAIGWWMGKAIHEHDGIPIGLVENAVGGSGTEAWLPNEVLAAREDYAELLDASWLDSEKISPWARGRAARNLGVRREANHPFKPGFLFESGVRDFAGFPFSGVCWYQGETNAEINDPKWNERLLIDLIFGWRKVLACGDTPFYLIQLPRIGGNDPLRAHWPEYRKAQEDAVKKTRASYLIVTKDLGWDSPDVHPPDKLPVAQRLAEAVLANPERG